MPNVAAVHDVAGDHIDELEANTVASRAVDELQQFVALSEHVTVTPLAERDEDVAKIPPSFTHAVLGAGPPATGVVLCGHEDAGGGQATQAV